MKNLPNGNLPLPLLVPQLPQYVHSSLPAGRGGTAAAGATAWCPPGWTNDNTDWAAPTDCPASKETLEAITLLELQVTQSNAGLLADQEVRDNKYNAEAFMVSWSLLLLQASPIQSSLNTLG